MKWEFSSFGEHLAGASGIGTLMTDLGEALARGGEVRMLGGGQPAHIPEIDAVWRRRMEELLADGGGFERMLGNYDPPRGNEAFLEALAGLLRRNFGWNVSSRNLAITNGGQTAFFFLFNLLAGRFADGRERKVLLPLVPEYIGYANQGVGGGIFRANRPWIEKTGPHEFKYRVDFDALEVAGDVAALCVSRPTNPTGNVLTDEEVARLAALAAARNVPLIIDNAYGAPFPNIIFSSVTPVWNENIILTLSLSKLGLPGTRTGIVVAEPRIAAAVAAMSAIAGLANGNIGQALLLPLVENDEVLRLSREVVRPFYAEKSAAARACVEEEFGDDFEYFIHRSEGAIFLWLWFPGLPVAVAELYERLKRRGVLIIPGHHFFFGLDDDAQPWPHRHECLRMTFTMDSDTVRAGVRAIAEEVRRAWSERRAGSSSQA
jgi:valine--pyruvate aminotransferase